MKRNIALYGSVAVVMIGLVMMVIAFGGKIARWGGYADSLAPLALLVLFVIGHVALTPGRRS